jgi:DNA ligase N terminus
MDDDNHAEDGNEEDLSSPLLEEDAGGDESDVVDDEGSTLAPPQEPSFSAANSYPFGRLVKRLEEVWNITFNTKKGEQPSLTDRLKWLMPPKEIAKFKTATNPPQSIYPIYRLLLPEIDTRQVFLKEAKIAAMYIAYYSLGKTHPDARKLENFNDPHYVRDGVGDFSLVLKSVLESRLPSSSKTKLTVGNVNELLDELATIGRRGSNWAATPGGGKPKASAAKGGTPLKRGNRSKPATPNDLRLEWLHKVMSANLSPIEHKWLVRIITKNTKYGIRHQKLLEWYDELAPTAYISHNSLKVVLNRLCGGHGSAKQQDQVNEESSEDLDNSNGTNSVLPYMKRFAGTVQIGVPFTPMFSDRTSFERLLTDISHQHEHYRLNTRLDHHCQRSHHNQGWDCLAMRHPAFCIETKLDGERLLVHHHRDGRVHMHTRHGNWYRYARG